MTKREYPPASLDNQADIMKTQVDSRLYPVFGLPTAIEKILDCISDDVDGDIELATILKFLGMCNGRISFNTAMDSLDEQHKKFLIENISHLVEADAISDVRAFYRIFHMCSMNPALAPPAFSAVEVEEWARFRPGDVGVPLEFTPEGVGMFDWKLGFSRSSAALTDIIVAPDSKSFTSRLFECIHHAYVVGPELRTVASAGGLYPISVYLALPAINQHETYTLVWYDPFSGTFFQIGESALSSLLSAFSPDPIVQHSLNAGVGLIFICGDTTRTCAKYGNRGYRFTLLEAGAVWQNIDLAAAELSMPIRAFGGFIDEKCTELLALPRNVYPMLTALIGE